MKNLRKNNMPFIHQIRDIDQFEEIYKLVDQPCSTQEKIFYTMIEGTRCLSVEDLFNEFAIKLKFPDYFGANWDAFDECLNDLNWLASEKYILFIKDFDYILVDQIDEFDTFIDILKLTVDEWVSGRIGTLSTSSFQIVIQSTNHLDY